MIDGSDLPQIHIANFDCCACEFSGVPKKLILCERLELQLPHKDPLSMHIAVVAEVVQGHREPPPKSLDLDVFLGQEVHYYMVYIANFTELILQISDYAQKRRI